ncbi:sulfatase [Anopheles sinensis]|uniref:Sulfatase n=1 Tax=Anopheles sinensis TaxID=74873 RepID=A0A084WCT9_ANOSI|nr:sulfatase [Anopheles sinensis]
MVQRVDSPAIDGYLGVPSPPEIDGPGVERQPDHVGPAHEGCVANFSLQRIKAIPSGDRFKLTSITNVSSTSESSTITADAYDVIN